MNTENKNQDSHAIYAMALISNAVSKKADVVCASSIPNKTFSGLNQTRFVSNFDAYWGYVVISIEYMKIIGSCYHMNISKDKDDNIHLDSDVVFVKIMNRTKNPIKIFTISPQFIIDGKAEPLIDEIADTIMLYKMVQ